MRITCVQMKVMLARPEENFENARRLIEKAAAEGPDVIVLPETWNTGFFPREGLAGLSDDNGKKTAELAGALAKKHRVNIVAGSVSNLKNGGVYNTAYVFSREGECIAYYDKTHLFSPAGEQGAYRAGDKLCGFMLDGVSCGLLICYDIRFPELCRTLALTDEGIEVLFLPSEWPAARIGQLKTLLAARAVENQMFAANCNACGKAGSTVYGGGSAIWSPLGEALALAGEDEALITADCSLSEIKKIREVIPVFRDRRSGLYQI